MTTVEHADILRDYPNHIFLKAGGQKIAYRVFDAVHGACVLKIGRFSDPESLERIQREVNTLRAIDSEYYPKNYDFKVVSDARFVILEQYVECRPLSECLTEYDELGVVSLLQHLVTGLQLLWDVPAVHRDIKPDNILITPSGKPKIIDLGIARLLELDSLTNPLIGAPLTRAYAAPEQIKNERIDFRADQFNLGILALQLLMQGAHPFDPSVVGSGSSIMQNILNAKWAREALSRLSAVPLKLLIEKLLGNQPYERYRTPQALTEAISGAAEAFA